MGDRATVILKFDISFVPQHQDDTPEHYEGVMVNSYKGLDPFGLVARSATGLEFFISNNDLYKFWNNYRDFGYETLRRMFDMDFIHRFMDVSSDIFMGYRNQVSAGRLSLEKVNSVFFSYYVDFGELFIDITGEAPDNLQVKYGFYHSSSLLDARSYAEKYKDWIGSEYPLLEDSFKMFDEMAELMTEEELEKFRNTDFSKYFVDFVPKPEEDLSTKDKMEWPIEKLDLQIRSHNCLKRANIHTIGQLAKKTKAELMQIRNFTEACVEDVCNQLAELDILLSE